MPTPINMAEWIREDFGGETVKLFEQGSAVMRATTRREPMKTDTKRVPREGDAETTATATGAAYTEDTESPDTVLLDACKHTYLASFNEEDLSDQDGAVNIVESKKRRATENLAKQFDNASLATVGTQSGIVRPYTSVYQATPAGNKKTLAAAANAAAARSALAATVEVAEQSDWATDDLVIIADPAFRSYFRNLVADGSVGVEFYKTTGSGGGRQEMLLDYPVLWTRAARLSTTMTYKPTIAAGVAGTAGNPIMVVGPRNLLIVGDRSPLESQFIDYRTGVGTLSDTNYLKMRRRVAFAVGADDAFGVLERIA